MPRRPTILFSAIAAASVLAGCGQAAVSAPQGEAPKPAITNLAPPTGAAIASNPAPLAYIVSQHSPLLDSAARTAISQDFNGVPLSGARGRHEINAEDVRCRSLNPPAGTPECSVNYASASGADQPVAITGDDATALFAALADAGVRDDAGMGHIVREVTALRCVVDDAAAQDTPAVGDKVAGFSCNFSAS